MEEDKPIFGSDQTGALYGGWLITLSWDISVTASWHRPVPISIQILVGY